MPRNGNVTRYVTGVRNSAPTQPNPTQGTYGCLLVDVVTESIHRLGRNATGSMDGPLRGRFGGVL